jgi:polyisoprenoid-binding protein YceI
MLPEITGVSGVASTNEGERGTSMKAVRINRFGTAAAMAVLLVSAASSAAAQQAVLQLDPARTKVKFTLGDVLHTVHGTFQLKSGIIRFDPSSGAASGQVIIDATSGESGNKSRDKKMHKEILESAQYPDITFIPSHVSGPLSLQGDSQVQVQGSFTLHGQSHPLTLIMPVQITGDDLAATTRFVIPYVSWGLKNPSTFLLRVSDKVTIDISAAGRVSR